MTASTEIIDTREAAKRLGVSLRRVQQFIESGRLPAQPIGRHFAIRVADLATVQDRPTGRPPKNSKSVKSKSKSKGKQ